MAAHFILASILGNMDGLVHVKIVRAHLVSGHDEQMAFIRYVVLVVPYGNESASVRIGKPSYGVELAIANRLRAVSSIKLSVATGSARHRAVSPTSV